MAELVIQVKKFKDIDIGDSFFDSLKNSYAEFSDWFLRKAEENAYVSYDEAANLQAFLYVKVEHGPVSDVDPPLNCVQCLKVGTFKINAHGTKLGERFVKIIVDTVLSQGLRTAYVTVFPEHEPLIKILKRYGFSKNATKNGPNGAEDVYIKDLNYLSGDSVLDYPLVRTSRHKKWLLAIRPEFHTDLFPDSILQTEDKSMVQDISHTNSISKVYIGFMRDFPKLSAGDSLVIYRCQSQDSGSSAWFKSVATSLCVVEETRAKHSFKSEEDFIKYCTKYSVFDHKKLSALFRRGSYNELYAIKMTYNWAFTKRPNLKTLVENDAVPDPSSGQYMGFFELEDAAFNTILQLGGIREGLVVD